MIFERFKIIADKVLVDNLELFDKKDIIIWGFGASTQYICDLLRKLNQKILFFVDSNKNIQNNITIFDPSILVNYKNSFIIVDTCSFKIDIKNFLDDIGFDVTNYLYIAQGYDFTTDDIFFKGCKIGKYTYGYQGLLSVFPIATEIGRFCSINDTAKIWNNHPVDYVTTHPFIDHPLFNTQKEMIRIQQCVNKYGKYFDNSSYENSALRKNKPVIIGNDVWIGAAVHILPGVKIGDGAIIATGAVITKDVSPYSIVGGVPAKLIKYRYPKKMIESFLRIKWWNWDMEKIRENLELFYQPELFCKTFDNLEFQK